MTTKLRKTYVELNKKDIGYVFEEFGTWVSVSYAAQDAAKVSIRRTSSSKSDAVQDVLDLHRQYGRVSRGWK